MTLSPLTTGLDPTPMLGYMPPRVLLAHIHASLAGVVTVRGGGFSGGRRSAPEHTKPLSYYVPTSCPDVLRHGRTDCSRFVKNAA
jgi:hypothetical protein